MSNKPGQQEHDRVVRDQVLSGRRRNFGYLFENADKPIWGEKES